MGVVGGGIETITEVCSGSRAGRVGSGELGLWKANWGWGEVSREPVHSCILSRLESGWPEVSQP